MREADFSKMPVVLWARDWFRLLDISKPFGKEVNAPVGAGAYTDEKTRAVTASLRARQIHLFHHGEQEQTHAANRELRQLFPGPVMASGELDDAHASRQMLRFFLKNTTKHPINAWLS